MCYVCQQLTPTDRLSAIGAALVSVAGGRACFGEACQHRGGGPSHSWIHLICHIYTLPPKGRMVLSFIIACLSFDGGLGDVTINDVSILTVVVL